MSSIKTVDKLKNRVREYIPLTIRGMRGDHIYKQNKKRLLSLLRANFPIDTEEYNKYKLELDYIFSNNDARIFPYEFLGKYKDIDVECIYDNEKKMFYVIHGSKRLYFPMNMKKKTVCKTYRSLIEEQDKKSPHRYISENINKRIQSAVFFDVGAAEGIISLDVVEKVSKIFIFEVDELWIKALEATFEPWKEKVQVVNKFVSSYTDEKNVMLDDFKLNENENAILKIDVEGNEMDVLKGAHKFLSCESTTVMCCTYHRNMDYDDIKSLLKNYSFQIETSEGYMLFSIDYKYEYPYFRRGLIRGFKS